MSLVVRRTTRQQPAAAPPWSRRTMARATQLSPSTIGRLWPQHGLKPQLRRTFKVSNDPHFAEKLEDLAGLDPDAPEHALVCCGEEPERSGDSPPIFPPKQSGQKRQGQALDRTPPGLPMKKGRASTFPHDYGRPGTPPLLAALKVAAGTVLGPCQARHRPREWLKFLRRLEAQTPAARDRHLILDHSATHNHPKVKAWRKKHPRFHRHFTPTGASWPHLVERFFRDLTTPAFASRSLSQSARVDRGEHRVPCERQCVPDALCLDGHGLRHPRQSQTRPPQAPYSPLNAAHYTRECSRIIKCTNEHRGD